MEKAFDRIVNGNKEESTNDAKFYELFGKKLELLYEEIKSGCPPETINPPKKTDTYAAFNKPKKNGKSYSKWRGNRTYR